MPDRIMSTKVSGPVRAMLFAILFVPLSLCVTGAEAEGTAAFRVAQSPGAQDRAKEIAAADAEIRSARGALEEARRRFEAGRKATTQDRVNQLEGGSTYTDSYYLRVEQLKADVAKAQQRLDRAITVRKAIGE